jgi:hypothetical protein
MPLERAARKYDHISDKKTKLADFIARPFEMIVDDAAYGEFRSVVKGLKEAIEGGKVEVGNRNEAVGHLLAVMNKNFQEEIRRVEIMRSEASFLKKEFLAMEHTLDSIRESKRNALEKGRTKEEIKERLAAVVGEKKATKERAEEMFVESYGRKVSISME